MPISFSCPQCNRNLTADDKLAGQTMKCPACQLSIILPKADIPSPLEDDLSLSFGDDPPSPLTSVDDFALDDDLVLSPVATPHTKPEKNIDGSDTRDIARDCVAKTSYKLEAIKLYRERTGANLSQAKEMIESVMDK